MQDTNKAAENFGSHGQWKDECESLSDQGESQELQASDVRPISKEAPN
jgi:hypothetical protein